MFYYYLLCSLLFLSVPLGLHVLTQQLGNGIYGEAFECKTNIPNLKAFKYV